MDTYDLDSLKKILTEIDNQSEIGQYIITRTKNILSLILQIIQEILEETNPLTRRKEIDGATLITDLEQNYQILKTNETQVLKNHFGETNLDGRINAVEVADSVLEEIVYQNPGEFSPLMGEDISRVNLRFLKVFLGY